MDVDRINEINAEEVATSIKIMGSTREQIIEAFGEDFENPLDGFFLLMDAPGDVRLDAVSLMATLAEAVDAWQRRENRIVDGRVALIAMDVLVNQQQRIMQRIIDEDIGPRGPEFPKNNN